MVEGSVLYALVFIIQSLQHTHFIISYSNLNVRDQAERLETENMENTRKAIGSMVHDPNCLSYDGLDEIIMCPCLLRIFFGIAVLRLRS